MLIKNFLRKIYVAIALIATCSLHAQLNNFTIGATATAQTCLGNGSLQFTVSGNNPGASLAFAVYLLPNTTTPFTTVTTMSAQNLVAGNYQIVATQILNGASNSASTTATVGDNTVPLAYTLAITNVSCNANGAITVNVTSGTATQYEIISGPVTFPLQTSNVFEGLTAGQYAVRVHDNCGDAFVTTVQLVSAQSDILLSVESNYLVLESCNTIGVRHYYSSENAIVYPLTFQYTVNPPGGAPSTTVSTTVNEFGNGYITTELPYFDQLYYYNISVTDGCGNVFDFNDFVINAPGKYLESINSDPCEPTALILSPNPFVTFPVTVAFTEAPAGFNPADFNTTNSVFTSGNIVYSQDGAILPLGTYSMVLTDACGRSVVKVVDVVINALPPIVETSIGCHLGTIYINMENKEAVEARITNAPPNYTQTLPKDIMDLYGNGSFIITDLPAGTYTFVIVDECGNTFTMTRTITLQPVQIIPSNMPGCTEGYGSINLTALNNSFAEVIFTGAPPAFTEILPFDAADYISQGQVFMNMLPAGIYTYNYTTQNCDEVSTETFTVTGYHATSDIDIIANCGSFDVYLKHVANDYSSGKTYWLQKYNEQTGTWGHPATGVVYMEQFGINSYNSIQLNNNSLNLNFPYTGQFRIVKASFVFGNTGTTNYPSCVRIIHEFTFTGAPAITAAYSFPCDNGLAEVIVVAEGVAPLTYKITTKNGQPFVVDNGEDNVFMALEKAVYNFRVTDDCNNLVNVLFDVSVLEPMAIEGGPFCNNQPGQLSLPQFTFLTYEWYMENDPDTILSTNNTLDFDSFSSDTEAGNYVVHLVSVTPGSCIDFVLEYNLIEAPMPQAGLDNSVSLCGGTNIDLDDYLVQPYQTGGTWQDVNSTGQLNGSLLAIQGLEGGVYQFKYIVALCDAVDVAVVTVEVIGGDSFPVVLEGKCVDEKFIISITNVEQIGATQLITWQGPGNFEYTGSETSIDATNMPAGEYFVEVTNAAGCSATGTLPVTNTNCIIPRGISPNGDEWNNDFDLSKFGVLHLSIFNRYGMKVYEANEYTDQWHGQSASGDLPTGTYYYVATLSAGLQKTGWVYLQREIK